MTDLSPRDEVLSSASATTRLRLPGESEPQAPADLTSLARSRLTHHLHEAEATPQQLLPSPPTALERDLYLGDQWRWVSPVSFLGYLLIVVSVSFFIYRHGWAWILIPALAVSFLGSLVSLFTSSRRRRDTLAGHRRRVAEWHPSDIASVDVFLPSAGEDLAVLVNTYQHVAALQWPGELAVHVLDDSGRREVAALAVEYGFVYHSRPDRGHFKKAGNLRYGFDHSGNDIILVLDADFVPRPDALSHLMPYLDDEAVGIVQSPQFFDVDTRMNWLQRAAGATQILFYRWVQPSRDRSNAAICVGTSALYRRSALEKAGGFALIGHSEDVHTGVRLMSAGFRVRYVPVVVTKGLCPDTMDQFMTQQYRWCTGSMSLLFSRDFHRQKFTVMQRLCYWSGFLYYITTAINVFTMSLPSILMAWFVAADVNAANYVFVLVALFTRQVVVPFITFRSETLTGLARVQTTYSFCHAVALVDVLRGRTDAWVATGNKTRSRTSVRVATLIHRWCIGVQVALWVAIVAFAPHYGLHRWWLLIGFTLLNLYVVYPLVSHSTRPWTFRDRRRQLLAVHSAWRDLAEGAPDASLPQRFRAMAGALARSRPGRPAGPRPSSALAALDSLSRRITTSRRSQRKGGPDEHTA